MRLTRGEGWWLLRRRAQLSQREMFTLQQVSEDRYRRWERDRAPAPMPAIHHGYAPPEALRDPLTWPEWCALQRRRRGWSLPEAARRIGISRVTLWKAEWGRTSGVARVRAFYGRLGPARPGTAAPVRLRDPAP